MHDPSNMLHDPDVLDQLTADTDVEFRGIALARFRLDLQAFMNELAAAAAEDRRRLLHTMSSSAALMGAMRLAGLCLKLEERAATLGARELLEIVRLAEETAALYGGLE